MEVHEPERDPLDFDVNSLTYEEIKLKLQEMRIKTRLRCRKKLQELLTTAILNKENVQQEKGVAVFYIFNIYMEITYRG